MQRFEVPIKFVSLNEYIELCKRRKGNYNPAQNYKHKVQNDIVMHIKRQRIEKIKKPVRLRFIWYEATKRRDKDNVAFGKKFLLDGMQSAGILPSDNNQWIAGFAGEDFVYGKGQKVVVEIYDCDEVEGVEK
jgi:hypothetical protein